MSIEEPPLILRGIKIDTPNFHIKIWVERTPIIDPHIGYRKKFTFIKDKKIIAVTRTTK
jgi:hypothetical protein